jgi:hypothetical protein
MSALVTGASLCHQLGTVNSAHMRNPPTRTLRTAVPGQALQANPMTAVCRHFHHQRHAFTKPAVHHLSSAKTLLPTATAFLSQDQTRHHHQDTSCLMGQQTLHSIPYQNKALQGQGSSAASPSHPQSRFASDVPRSAA